MGACCSSDDEGPINPLQVDQSHFSMMKVVGKGGFGKVNAVTRRNGDHQLLAMKRMKKSKLLAKKMYVVTAWRERNVMAQLQSPFLVNLIHAFQDKHHLFLLMPFMQGGDLRYYLNTQGRMSEKMCRYYAAEMILGLEELHQKHIVYRDLKPDNVLFDAEGHLRISDFGLAVFLRPESDYLISGGAGTPGYQAPEVLKREKYGPSADVWSLGVTIYELLERARPFRDRTDEVLKETRIGFHADISREAKDLIRGMLHKDPTQRLGCGKDKLEEIKRHPWFASIDWVKIANKQVKPPFQPDVNRANCSADFELQDQFFSDKEEEEISPEDQKNFVGYEFNVDLRPKVASPKHKPSAEPRLSAPTAPPSEISTPADRRPSAITILPGAQGGSLDVPSPTLDKSLPTAASSDALPGLVTANTDAAEEPDASRKYPPVLSREPTEFFIKAPPPEHKSLPHAMSSHARQDSRFDLLPQDTTAPPSPLRIPSNDSTLGTAPNSASVSPAPGNGPQLTKESASGPHHTASTDETPRSREKRVRQTQPMGTIVEGSVPSAT